MTIQRIWSGLAVIGAGSKGWKQYSIFAEHACRSLPKAVYISCRLTTPCSVVAQNFACVSLRNCPILSASDSRERKGRKFAHVPFRSWGLLTSALRPVRRLSTSTSSVPHSFPTMTEYAAWKTVEAVTPNCAAMLSTSALTAANLSRSVTG
jgi:hypothetical protein